MGRNPGCGSPVCLIPYKDFIIVLVGGLLIRTRRDFRMVRMCTVLLTKPWGSVSYVLFKYTLLEEDITLKPTLWRYQFINYAGKQWRALELQPGLSSSETRSRPLARAWERWKPQSTNDPWCRSLVYDSGSLKDVGLNPSSIVSYSEQIRWPDQIKNKNNSNNNSDEDVMVTVTKTVTVTVTVMVTVMVTVTTLL